ncbi:hypothetical protein BH10PSE16_BH10PSE16_43170 [soil metagenome]
MTHARHTFTDAQWQRIEPLMPACKGRPGGAYRAFFDARPARARPGATCLSGWAPGTWCTSAVRIGAKRPFRAPFSGRAAARHGGGHGELDLLQSAPIVSRGTKSQRPAGHRPHARRAQLPKIHAVCDALGNPLRFVLTAGQRHGSKPVPELLDGLQAKALLADKAYDTDKIVQAAQECGMRGCGDCSALSQTAPAQ